MLSIKPILLFLLTLGTVSRLSAQHTISLSSPDKAIQLSVQANESGIVTYRISYKSKKAIEPLGVGFVLSKPQVSLTQFTLSAIDSSTHDDTWKPVWGEVAQIRNHYKELALTLTDKGTTGIRLLVRFRVFNDGVGFRYEFPEQTNLTHFIVADEKTLFTLSGDHKTFWQP
ncbi:glycoside hydrolase family 97 N-terminal domain-containing protein [Spirosoma aerolatum]|uniref:glycoside hydrolase family 97 N-terminal domain-containing protein n=1 Tax=Spirosoma aerolatum TaxID=1211326 RepID=UPI0009AD954E|nr:glycoside hydrolase family 97 N-terminal domain-containing protein [Spirosoma aerolatum]